MCTGMHMADMPFGGSGRERWLWLTSRKTAISDIPMSEAQLRRIYAPARTLKEDSPSVFPDVRLRGSLTKKMPNRIKAELYNTVF